MKIINYLKRKNGSSHIVEHVGYHDSGDYLLRELFSESERSYRQHKYEVEKEYEVVDASDVKKLERQTCPSRLNDFGPWERIEKIDFWRSMTNGDKVCSFCGSMHPDSVLEAVRQYGSQSIEKSTKSYKWYINRPGIDNVYGGGIKYYRAHDTQEFVEELNKLISK